MRRLTAIPSTKRIIIDVVITRAANLTNADVKATGAMYGAFEDLPAQDASGSLRRS
jgi:hypothetical protein